MTRTTLEPAVLTMADAVAYTRQSESTIKRALKATDPASFPPPLRAKKKGTHPKAPLQFFRTELDAWLQKFPDA
jgi:hypothetical protein